MSKIRAKFIICSETSTGKRWWNRTYIEFETDIHPDQLNNETIEGIVLERGLLNAAPNTSIFYHFCLHFEEIEEFTSVDSPPELF